MVQRLSTSSSVTKHILSHDGALARSLPSQTRRRQSLGTSVCGRHCRRPGCRPCPRAKHCRLSPSVSTLSASAMADKTSTPNVFLVTSISTGKGKARLLTHSIAYLCILSERLGSFHSMHAALSQQINSPLSMPDPLRHSHHLKLPSSFGCSSFTFFFRVCISSERRTTPTPVKWFRKLLLRNSLASSSVNLAERSSKKK